MIWQVSPLLRLNDDVSAMVVALKVTCWVDASLLFPQAVTIAKRQMQHRSKGKVIRFIFVGFVFLDDKVKQNLPIISGEPLQISRKMIQKRHFEEKDTKKAPGKNLGAL